MTIPERVAVLGESYAVHVGRRDADMMADGTRGEISHTKLEIDIRSDLAPAAQEEALLHELIHAVDDAVLCEADRLTEAQVHALSGGLYHVLTQNGFWPR